MSSLSNCQLLRGNAFLLLGMELLKALNNHNRVVQYGLCSVHHLWEFHLMLLPIDTMLTKLKSFHLTVLTIPSYFLICIEPIPTVFKGHYYPSEHYHKISSYRS